MATKTHVSLQSYAAPRAGTATRYGVVLNIAVVPQEGSFLKNIVAKK